MNKITNQTELRKQVQIVLAYIPVLHQGYLDFFNYFANANQLYIVERERLQDIAEVRKDIRYLPAKLAKQAIDALKIFKEVKILNDDNLREIDQDRSTTIGLTMDDIGKKIKNLYFQNRQVCFAPTFLMWDKHWLKNQELISYDCLQTSDNFDTEMMAMAQHLSHYSNDWWLHVGAILVKNQKILLTTYNQHTPSAIQHYFDADPHNSFHAGQNIENSSAIHAEALIIAQSAKLGITTQDTAIYVTHFPCPICAKQIAYAGIKTVYFLNGYSNLQAQEILKLANVKLIQVKINQNHNLVKNYTNIKKSN